MLQWAAERPEGDTLSFSLRRHFPDAGQHGIWMKGMLIPLDIVWLDERGTVIHLIEEAPIPSNPDDLPVYTNLDPAKYVLELAAGTVADTGLRVGAEVGLS